MILGLDPGPEQSAVVGYDPQAKQVVCRASLVNQDLLEWLRGQAALSAREDVLVIEMVASYGMAVGQTTFETCVWIGRFLEVWCAQTGGILPARLARLAVKVALCHDSRAKDANIRQALIDRFGPPGTKRRPGALYGIRRDEWSALAVAVAWWDQATHG